MSATSNLNNLGPTQFSQFGQYTVDSANPYYCTPLKRTPVSEISADSAGNITYTVKGKIIENESNAYSSDYAGGSLPFGTNVTLNAPVTENGESDALSVVLSASINTFSIRFPFSTTEPSGSPLTPFYKVEFQYYIPNANTNLNGLELTGFTTDNILDTTGSWVTVSIDNLIADGGDVEIICLRDGFPTFNGSSDAFYLKDVVVTEIARSEGEDLSRIIEGSKVIITNCPSEQNNGIKFISNVIDSADTITVTNNGIEGVDETADNAVLEIHAPKTTSLTAVNELTISSIEVENNRGAATPTTGYTAGSIAYGDFRELVVTGSSVAKLSFAPDFLSPEEA